MTPPDMLPPAPSRAEAGLPETGFVFCCFNNSWKITAARFRHLDAAAGAGAGQRAVAAGWTPGAPTCASAGHGARHRSARLVFAPKLALEQHLARHQLADLFLDTLPYNAHTTCSDALWAGVPVVTCYGKAFPGRVAASLLKAIDLPELVTTRPRGL